ncbi:hypothetical protein FO519_000143 [Halicephalobus sp. NKZ332]|nr:hypothetical protein FO519_000143 [Halicephalobus sp. NKZ332]
MLNPLIVGINLVVDFAVIATVPVYILFLRHLAINKKYSDNIRGNGFALIMFASGFWDLTNSLISLFFVEIPHYGIWKEFFETDDPWKSRITKGFTMGSQIFQMISASSIAINRWFAINRSLTYNSVFSPRNMKLLYIFLYILTIIYISPILLVANTKPFSYDDGIMFYGFDDPMFVFVYGLIYTLFSCITVIIWIVIYSQICVYIANNVLEKSFMKNKVKKTVIKVTAASFIFTLGTIFTFVITISSDVAWRFFGIGNLYSVEVYYCLTRMREGILQQLICCTSTRKQVFRLSTEKITNSGGQSVAVPSVSTVPMRNIAEFGFQRQDQIRMNMVSPNPTVFTRIG